MVDNNNFFYGKRILVTGSSGLVGSALIQKFKTLGCDKLFLPRSNEFDLRNKDDVDRLFRETKPDLVFSLAAKVGGILDNRNNPADFYFENTLIATYTFEACARYGAKKLVSIGAGCGYPLGIPEPLKETQIWEGLPQGESKAYSLVKKMLLVQSEAYRLQHGLDSITLIPSNIYGPNDNFNLIEAHVIPALVRKFFEAVANNQTQVVIWGDGSAKRDFIHSSDLADAILLASEKYSHDLPLNICYGRQYSVKEVVDVLTEISGFSGKVFWDTEMPSGQNSREFSIERTRQFLPDYSAKISLKDGLTKTYSWLSENYNTGVVRL